mmetsp:Transcript_13053/g.19786  ORF Transcript_13053/g.19786 Transcript_13053/m.19786 type:complete len:293 (+) Transcript_13053:41-919(+)
MKLARQFSTLRHRCSRGVSFSRICALRTLPLRSFTNDHQDREPIKNETNVENIKKKDASSMDENNSIFSFSRTKDASNATNDEDIDWVSMYEAIKTNNHFIVDIDSTVDREQWTHYNAINTRFWQWLTSRAWSLINTIIARHHALKFEEFMVGVHYGMRHILYCLQNNDEQGFAQCVSAEVLPQFDALREEMFTEQYTKVGKIMTYLIFEKRPIRYPDKLDVKYHVTYYYQLLRESEEDTGSTDDYVQKRADIVWHSLWMQKDGLFRISDDGWRIEDIRCCSVPKSTPMSSP